MRVLVPLLCAALCVTSADRGFEGTCLKEGPAPGVLVVAPGSNLSLTCGGRVMLDGMEVTVNSETPTARAAGHTTPRTPPPTGAQPPDATADVRASLSKARRATKNPPAVSHSTQSAIDIVTGGNGQQTTPGNSRKRRESPLRRASPERDATPTANALRPIGAVGVAVAETDWPVGDTDSEYVSYGDGDEGGQGGRPQWRLNGRTLGFGEGVFERNGGRTVSIPSVSEDHSGRYRCLHRGKALSSIKVIVAEEALPEQPTLSCYKRSPTSKIRCEWTPQQPVVLQSHCYLYLDKHASDSFSRVNCSFSRHPSRCWCSLDHREEERRVLHLAYLCVTSMAGSATSPLLSFIPMGIIKPEPPSAVAVRAVEGYTKMLRVTWGFPCSWKRLDRYYELIYQISYRPTASQQPQSESVREQHYTITDALPAVEYVITLRAKDEYDGLWSDWSTPVYAYSWAAPPVTWEADPFATVDPFSPDVEGSGIDLPVSQSDVLQDQEWMHALWISGLCVLLSLILAVYAFRHRERFVSKLLNLNVIGVCAADPHPHPRVTTAAATAAATATAATTGQALVTFAPVRYKDPLPNEVQEEEEEEEEEEDGGEDKREAEGKPEKRSEAISFNNTSYFLLQTDRDNVPQQSGPKCL